MTEVKIEELSSSRKVAERVCEQFGHRIGVLDTKGITVIEAKKHSICLACGMSLEEIRGEKPNAK